MTGDVLGLVFSPKNLRGRIPCLRAYRPESTPPPYGPGGGVSRYGFLEICGGRPSNTLRPANHVSQHTDDNLPSTSQQVISETHAYHGFHSSYQQWRVVSDVPMHSSPDRHPDHSAGFQQRRVDPFPDPTTGHAETTCYICDSLSVPFPCLSNGVTNCHKVHV